MRDYIKESMPDSWQRNVIKKIRFGEVLHGMVLGGAYAFDEEAYDRYWKDFETAFWETCNQERLKRV